jgi:hypothetical protein
MSIEMTSVKGQMHDPKMDKANIRRECWARDQ